MLVLHTAIGVAAVGAATHLVLWMRLLLRGQYGRLRSVRRFAWILLALQIGGFVAGNAMYPTYRVEVRAAYLEDSRAITDERDASQHARERVAAREAQHAPLAAEPAALVRGAAGAVKWFDIKEHWIAFGILSSLGLVLVLSFWDPRRGGRELAPITFGLALVSAGTLWLAAIVGVLTASWRAV